MANPSYSLDNVSFVTLPGAYRLGGRPRSREQEAVVMENDNLGIFAYDNGTRRIYEIHWRLTNTQTDTHDALDEAVNGIVNPFYFSLSGAGAGDSVLVRKEPGFDPQELDSPGGSEAMFDYVLRLKEEIV